MKLSLFLPLLLAVVLILPGCAVLSECYERECGVVEAEPIPPVTTPAPEVPEAPAHDLVCVELTENLEGETFQFFDADILDAEVNRKGESIESDLVAEFDHLKREVRFDAVLNNVDEVVEWHNEHGDGQGAEVVADLVAHHQIECDALAENHYSLEVRNMTACELAIDYVVVLDADGNEVRFDGEDLIAVDGSEFHGEIFNLGPAFNDAGFPEVVDVAYTVDCDKPSKDD